MYVANIIYLLFVVIDKRSLCNADADNSADATGTCDLNSHKYRASIAYDKEAHTCSGTLIAFNCVVTAAQCCNETFLEKLYKVSVGMKNQKLAFEVLVSEKIMHLNYSAKNGENDICLLKTDKAILQGMYTLYAKFVAEDDYADVTDPVCTSGQYLYVDKNDELKCATLKLTDRTGRTKFTFEASGTDELQYDLGAPYICDGFIYGLAIAGGNGRPFVFLEIARFFPNYLRVYLSKDLASHTTSKRSTKWLLMISLLYVAFGT